MPKSGLKLLLVEDNKDHAALVTALLHETSPVLEFSLIENSPSTSDALTRLQQTLYDICLLDYQLGDTTGLELLHRIKERGISTPVIFLTGMGDEGIAVQAMKGGAKDYVRKDSLSAELLATSIRYALEVHQNERLRKEAQDALQRAKEELEMRVEERTVELRKTNQQLQAEIGERKRAEEELRNAYGELQEADRLRTEMIQNVSHEFRTPLGYILGYVELLLDDRSKMGPLTDEQRSSLEVVAQQTHRLSRLVDNFVSIQLLKTIALAPEPVEVRQLMEESIDAVRLDAAEKEIELHVDLSPDPATVMVDRLAISQVLDNLLANALKFTDQGGEIKVRTWSVPSEKKVYVSVSDTGIGISPEYQMRIFERFYQVSGTTTRKYGGVGLGLAVCKEIIEAHGEKLWVESNEGDGASFYFTMTPAA